MTMDDYIRHNPYCRYCGHEMFPHRLDKVYVFLCDHCGAVSPSARSKPEAFAKATAKQPKSKDANKGTF